MRRPSKKKVITIAVAGVCLVALFVVVFPGCAAAIIGPPLDKAKARRALSRAKTPEELRAAVGKLGAFFPLPDGSWVAIRHTDSHAAPGYSCAVAHDSGGQWFFSSYHFCGRFRNYVRYEEQTRKLGLNLGESEEEIHGHMARTDAQMFALANATNLASARAQLLTMGFSP